MLRTAITLASVSLFAACGAPLTSLGELPTDNGSGATGGDTGASGTEPADCGPVQLADVAQGVGGFAVDGAAQTDHAGSSLSGAGDINGDGLADIVLGAQGADTSGMDDAGRTYVVFGRADTARIPLAEVAAGVGGFAVDGEVLESPAIPSVSGAGDVNGDGIPDLIVGAYWSNPNGGWLGRTYVVFGKTDTDNVSLADVAQGVGGFALDGEEESDRVGSSVSGAGDVNGDGLHDVLVGASYASPNGVVEAGRTYVVFGQTDSSEITLEAVAQGVGGFAMNGEGEGSRSGYSVSGAGDVNGDGRPDILLAAPFHSVNGDESGRAYVVFGKADTESVSLADVAQGIGGFTMDGEAAYDRVGMSVSGAGDLNGDGLADVLVGAWHGGPERPDPSNRTYVAFGKTDTHKVALPDVAQGIGGFALDGQEEGAYRASGAGDVNGDAVPDIIIGAPWATVNGFESGRTYVVFGGDFSCEGG